MAVTQLCPACDSPNSPYAKTCSCGHSFPSRRGGPVSRMWKGVGFALLGFVLVLWASQGLVEFLPRRISLEGLTIAGCAVALGGIWVFLSGLGELIKNTNRQTSFGQTRSVRRSTH